ncbi:MAG: hypothetical protein IT381_17895 [Deltaproteobacteria bacterium]|nr:hypothetical protein [Deltaproteobacteria bacterium]
MSDPAPVRIEGLRIVTPSDREIYVPWSVAPREAEAFAGTWDAVPFKARHAEIIFDRALLPGFGFLLPIGRTTACIGVCEAGADDSAVEPALARLIDKHYRHRLSGAKLIAAPCVVNVAPMVAPLTLRRWLAVVPGLIDVFAAIARQRYVQRVLRRVSAAEM